ncbi:MAG: response regulator transcription factor [Anaerovoracaceae bacterium]
MKLLIIEDDKALNDGIALSFSGSEVLQAYSLEEARRFIDLKPDLAILDINLPDGSGLDFCREIRGFCQTPVIFLTANDMEIDIVAGLESGADDYITKPFSLAVLRARVNAVLRRKQTDGSVFSQGEFFFDFENMIFRSGDEPAELSKTEQKLLKTLVSNRGVILSRETLLNRIWSDGPEFVEENALSVTVNRLRKKLPGLPVKTIYGVGYTWEK